MEERYYDVSLHNSMTGELVESHDYPAGLNPQSAKDSALTKAKSLKEKYREDIGSGKYQLYCVASVARDAEVDEFYLDEKGNENLEAVNWLK